MLICSTSRVLVWVRVCWSRVLSKRSNLESQARDLKILLDWAEKASVRVVASLVVSRKLAREQGPHQQRGRDENTEVCKQIANVGVYRVTAFEQRQCGQG